MRKGEVTGLTWGRVDMKEGFIRLGTDTKTAKPRLVPISPRLRSVLEGIWQREKGGKVVTMTDRVFLYRGKPFKGFYRAFQTACKEVGIGGLWIHDLRATFATRKIDEGFDRDWVKMITGHLTDHVFKRYNRPSREMLKSVVAKDVHNMHTQDGAEEAEVGK